MVTLRLVDRQITVFSGEITVFSGEFPSFDGEISSIPILSAEKYWISTTPLSLSGP
jgi:hypothetical protein